MLNKKGFSLVDTMVSMFILLIVLGIVFQFLTYIKVNRDRQDNMLIVTQQLNNEIERAYRTIDWPNISGQEFNTRKGMAVSTFTNYELTPFHTEKLTVSFELEDLKKSIDIERSVFWSE